MAAFGEGSSLWRVDVVVRREGVTDENADAVIALLIQQVAGRPSTDDEAVFPDVRTTRSYDMEPPDGSIGVSCWVRADEIGEAVQVAHDAVQRACTEVTGRTHRLWDVRALPREAITPRSGRGTPLTSS